MADNTTPAAQLEATIETEGRPEPPDPADAEIPDVKLEQELPMVELTITDEMRQGYLDCSGAECPNCGQDSMEYQGDYINETKERLEKVTRCLGCGAIWKEIYHYKLTDIERA